ncbi:alpha/beta fold hydrolase [Agrilutibacter solisilvae]|uniref:alpha/beta fold hydrolase n=1 Tax=Agrilutibacter solisilvae TaxID=2763317 RepID=UPI001FD6E1BB|nr:alpha/beta hydrolase [Lysobacter solisilvae]
MALTLPRRSPGQPLDRIRAIHLFLTRTGSPRTEGISIPVLDIHGDDDQVVPYGHSGVLSAKRVKSGKLLTCKGAPHGIPTTHADQVNADLLAFLPQE